MQREGLYQRLVILGPLVDLFLSSPTFPISSYVYCEVVDCVALYKR